METESKRCYTCNKLLPLDAYPVNRRKFCLKSDKARNKVCLVCDMERTKNQMFMLRFNFTTNKYDRIEFSNLEEINDYYEKNIISLMSASNTSKSSTKGTCPYK